jgi:RNA polymerase sigma-70 factor (ECF subfamily)
MDQDSAVPARFQTVHDEFRPRVLRQLTRMVGASEAEDLTQAVMLKVSDGLAAFRGDAALSTWIHRIATNAALDLLRRKKLAPAGALDAQPDEIDDAPDPDTPSLEAVAIRRETGACIRAFIGRLPDNYRSVLVLSEVEGFTNEEIAAVLSLTLGTVKIRLHRAREKLRAELAAGCSFDHDAGGDLGCDPKPAAVGA